MMRTDLIFGRHPVREALMAGPVSKVYLANGSQKKNLSEILSLVRSKKVPHHWVDRARLDEMIHGNHQGVIAQVSPLNLASLEDVLERAAKAQTKGPAAIFLDGILDPQNLGSIIRSAVFFGVSGVIIPKWRAAPLTTTAVRASAGAAQHILIASVTNLADAMTRARKKGIWLIGADMDGEDAKKADLPRPFALVLGSEGRGLGQLIRKKCDTIVGIQCGASKVSSLNVGAACAALLYQFT